jgi:hypothetical protein
MLTNEWRTKEYDHTPSGRLAFHVEDYEVRQVRRTWRDGRRRTLEHMLDRVVAGLEVAAAAKKAEQERWQAYHRELEERRRHEEELRQMRVAEERRVRALEHDLAALTKCRLIRQYVDGVREHAKTRGISAEPGTPLGDWLSWVADHAAKCDPATRLEPPDALRTASQG